MPPLILLPALRSFMAQAIGIAKVFDRVMIQCESQVL